MITETFRGNPCKKCGSRTRYSTNRCCVACQQERSRERAAKKRQLERDMRAIRPQGETSH